MSEIARHNPADFPRRILLATVGLAPQVVTETVYALVTRAEEPFRPTEIHLVTTALGEKVVRESLLGERGKMAALAADIGRPELAHALAPDRVHVIRAGDGRPLDDIDSGADQDAAADLITDLVRQFTIDESAALHGSIAGGRKSMGFLLGYAFTLFGRGQDRLSHVLVNAPFESHPQFYFPPSVPLHLTTRDGTSISTSAARLILADVPFVRLRANLPRDILEGRLPHSETVRRAQQAIPEPELVLDPARGAISCGGVVIELTPKPYAFYAWMARRRIAGKPGVHWSTGNPAELLAEYQQTGASAGDLERQRENLEKGIPTADFETNKSRINTKLRDQLGRLAEPYLIRRVGTVPHAPAYSLFGLTIDPTAISFGTIERPSPAELARGDD